MDELLKFQHRVDQRATSLADDMIRELEAVRASLTGRLAVLADELLQNPWEEEILSRRMDYLSQMRQEVEEVLAGVYERVGGHLKDAGADVIEATAKHVAMATGVSFTLGPKLISEVVESWFETSTVEGLVINDFLSKLRTSAADRIISAGRRSLIEGLGTRAAARLMRVEGIEGSVPGLEGLARTFLLSASHHAREKTIETHFKDSLKGWEYVATLDGRTCPVCGADDGKVYAPDEKKPVLPRHWRCRCCYAPVGPTFRDLGVDIDELPDVERAATKNTSRKVHHRDGSTSTQFKVKSVEHTTETYQQWLRRQLDEDPAFVKSVLGRTRFELFKSGKLPLDKMSTNGRLKRLTEL